MPSDGALIIDTGLNNNGLIRDRKRFKSALDMMVKAAQNAGIQMAKGANAYTQAISKSRSATKGLTGEQAAIQKEIAKTEARLRALSDKQEIARRKFDAAREAAIQKANDEFRALNAGMEAMPWESPEQAAQQFEEDLSAHIQAVIDKFGVFEETTQFSNLSAETEFLNERLSELRAQLDGTSEGEQETAGPAGGLGRAFAGIATSAGRALAVIGRFAGTAAVGFLKKLASGAKNAAIQLAKLAGSAIKGGLKKLGGLIGSAARSMFGFNRASKLADGGLKSSLMSILKYGLGIRGLFMLFRKLRTAVKDGFEAMSQNTPAVKGALDSLRGALNGLKGSLATAFAPILTAVAPALTTLINLLTSAINAIGMFMAALTGQKTYQAAVAGLEGVGGAASGAAGSVKDLKRQLAGFDQLNILSADQSGGGGGGGGGGAGSGLQYETQEISGGITDFVQKLKDLWANADYEGIGREIAGAINGAFEKAKDLISWDALGGKITQAVDAITGIFNGLVDGIDWDLIGRTFGTGINTILNTVNQLLTKIDWENLGKKLSEGLNGLVSTVNWSNLGAMFANKLNALIDTIKGAVSAFKWSDAGTAFARTVNGLFSGINWDDLSKTAAKSINGIIATLRTAVNGFNWDYAGETFARTVNGLFSGINWNDLSKTAAKSINGIIATLRTAVNGFKWDYAGETFARTVNGLFSGINWDDLSETAAKSINGIIATLRTAVNGFKWDYAGETFARTVNGLFSGINWDDLSKTAAKSINGIIATLRTAVNGFKWDYAGETFARTVNGLINTIDWTALGKLAAESIAKPLSALLEAVRTFEWGDAGKAFSESVNAFFGNEELWADAAAIISETVKGIFVWSEDFLDNLDAEQIASDIIAFITGIDWDGIAKAIWSAAITAIRKLGNLFLALVFGPDYKDKTKKQQEVEDYVSGLINELPEGRNFTVNFGLNLYADTEADAFEKLWASIEEGLKTGNWTVPVGLDVPAESIEAARQEFISEWNSIHPEAPIDPTLPADTAQQVQSEWDSKKPELKTDAEVSLVKGTSGNQTVDSVYSDKDKKIQGNVDLVKDAKGKQTVESVYSDRDKLVKGKTRLGKDAKGKQTVENVYSDKEKQVNGKTKLSKSKGGNQTVENVYSDKDKTVNGRVQLVKSGWKNIASFVGTAVTTKVSLTNSGTNWASGLLSYLTGNSRGEATVKVNLTNGAGGTKWVAMTQALGGVLNNGFWKSLPQYARGTLNAGTLFAAGEAGPEVVGHIGGRTEVLNKSQLASTMFSAVENGMLSAIGRLRFRAPAMSTGSVLPYDVAAQIAATGASLETTLNANNEDLIQTIISVAGQIVAAVQHLNTGAGTPAGGLTPQQIINEINRRTQMFSASPLKGV